MPLTRRQKNRLWGLFAVCLILGFFSGIGYLVYWSGETTGTQHFCSGTIGFTVTNTNGDGTSVTWKPGDPSCR